VNCSGTNLNEHCMVCLKEKLRERDHHIGIGVTVVGVFVFFMGFAVGVWLF